MKAIKWAMIFVSSFASVSGFAFVNTNTPKEGIACPYSGELVGLKPIAPVSVREMKVDSKLPSISVPVRSGATTLKKT